MGLRDLGLDEAVERARRLWERLTPEERREMRVRQRRSWALGELRLQYPNRPVAELEVIVDSVMGSPS